MTVEKRRLNKRRRIKQQAKERRQKTGEKYSEARRQILNHKLASTARSAESPCPELSVSTAKSSDVPSMFGLRGQLNWTFGAPGAFAWVHELHEQRRRRTEMLGALGAPWLKELREQERQRTQMYGR